MSNDPFDELFGPDRDEPPTQPVPQQKASGGGAAGAAGGAAAARGAQAQGATGGAEATPVRTAQLRTEPRAAGPRTSDDEPVSRAKPWVIVGLVAVAALVVSIVVVNVMRGQGTEDSASSQQNEATSQPTDQAGADDPAATPSAEEEEAEKKDEVPTVQVGDTNRLPIETWGVTGQLSTKFGMTSYVIPDNVNLQLNSPLINELPDSCGAMRTQWGVTRQDNGEFVVRKPAETCADAPELYDELWGLTDAFVQTLQ